ncbi:adenine-specific DNA-methyltransferase [Schumannella luteola]|uniref:Methyltransferase n=1 Tax=Schumannella luteola TaxID=472059 RepID=A0A852YGU5_9MICO|nr:site-specific DNA-methyltransferase [Schumannella luteola]NYG98248.1 site-specific DNA-methyltransferase (adenine-specific) [Schumannella luteola]TPX02137.1 site-specific DNA-methyltransferase [Schumannella luteola]
MARRRTTSAPLWTADSPDTIVHGDNLAATAQLPDGAFQLVYLDPPFNTGREQRFQSISTVRRPTAAAAGSTDEEPLAETGDDASTILRRGFGGRDYTAIKRTLIRYDDRFADYWEFLEPRLAEAWRLLADTGTLYLHLDYREAHYAKLALDALFGRECFLNELIWAYDYGAKTARRWPAKHDTILVYVKNPRSYYFDAEAVDREPYMAPGLVTPEQAERGKRPTDVWWHTIVPTSGHERTGYATQKPEGVLRRIVQASSAPGDWVLDFFAGSGTTGAVATQLGRRALLIDQHPDAVRIMRQRIPSARVVTVDGTELPTASPEPELAAERTA